VVNEIAWTGNADPGDEWIELKNVSGAALDLSGWTLSHAGAGGAAVVLDEGTVLADGGFLLIASLQGPDVAGSRTSLTGVANVQIHDLDLADAGVDIALADPTGATIDATPSGPWAAGHAGARYSMERRDDVTGGGYTDGTAAAAWYTWSSLDGTDTTHPDSTDRGTPGADNTDPGLFDHFGFALSNPYPAVDADFDVTVTAYSSTDDSAVIATYTGTLSVASVTLQHDTVTSGLTLTFTDDIYPDVTGTTAAFDIWAGDHAATREVVINEVNWFGNLDSTDEWIELRNVSGRTLHLGGWSIDNAGSSTSSIEIDAGTVLASGGYLLLAYKQTSTSSLYGLAGVQVQPLNLANGGETLTLRDVADVAIDSAPATWPAGNNDWDTTMERRDDATGGGYTDGAVAGAWYTWNPADGNRDTTNPLTSDRGTPGAVNTNPAATYGTIALPYATSFEQGQPPFVKLVGAGSFLTVDAAIAPRTGAKILYNSSLTTAYTGRDMRSGHCIVLDNATADVVATSWGVQENTADANTITARLVLLWFTDAACTTPASTANANGADVVLVKTGYSAVDVTANPPDDATHFQIRFEVHDSDTASLEDDWAADDVAAHQ
jgi:hypothetical protein